VGFIVHQLINQLTIVSAAIELGQPDMAKPAINRMRDILVTLQQPPDVGMEVNCATPSPR
jgi:hypothetical protein